VVATDTEVGLLEDYCWQVIQWWYVLIPGVLFAVIDIVERSKKKDAPIPTRWIVWTLVAGLIVAQFLAYRDMHKSTQQEIASLQAENARLTSQKPDFTFEFKQIGTGAWEFSIDNPITKEKKRVSVKTDTVIVISGDLSNVGAMQSGARNWLLTVQPVGRDVIPAILQGFGNMKTITMAGETLPLDKYLPEITIKPITQGESRTGFLVFRVQNTPDKTIGVKGTIYKLSCVDALGKTHVFLYIGTGVNGGPIYMPGLSH